MTKTSLNAPSGCGCKRKTSSQAKSTRKTFGCLPCDVRDRLTTVPIHEITDDGLKEKASRLASRGQVNCERILLLQGDS